jgi:dUTP pyrophosphatase
MILHFKRCHPNAKAPERAHGKPHSDSGFDLFSPVEVVIPPRGTLSIDVGIAIELPRDSDDWIYEAVIRPRSSLRKKGILSSVGTIDSGFRGEIGCILHSFSDEPYFIHVGDKICQLVIQKLPVIYNWLEVQELSSSERGVGRYGSTGR